MSDAYRNDLVKSGASGYERAAGLGVVLALVLFGAAVGTFFGWVPTTDSVAGTPGLTYFGVGLVGLGLLVIGLGGVSRWASVGTAPGTTTGVIASTVVALVWTLTTAALSTVVDLGALTWVIALAAGGIVWFATIATREDLGTTLPIGALLALVGGLIAAGVLGPGWSWESTAFALTVEARTVVPLLTMGCGLLGVWTAGKAYGGFGATGRQQGAFLLVSLVVVLVVGVLAFLLVYVFERGIGTVVENLAVNAGTLVVLLALPLVVLARQARRGLGARSGARIIVTYVRLGVGGLLGLAVAALAYALVTGTTLSTGETAIEPSAVAGAVPTLAVSALALWLLRAESSPWRPTDARQRTVKRVFVGLAAILGPTVAFEFVSGPLTVAGISVVETLAMAAIGLGAVALLERLAADARSTEGSALLPPRTHSGQLVLWGLVIACLHATVTGEIVGTSAVGIVDGGTIAWPFVTNPTQGLGIQIGIFPALMGTIWIVLGAVVFAVPIAVGAAVFLTEYAEDSAFTSAVDIATNGLWSTPSIVFGLFGLAFIVPRFGNSGSILASQLVLGFMLLPLVLITSREAMKSVPDEYRDASAALGVSKWDTIREVVIPASMPGIITGVILGVGRIAGETAPLLLVLNGPVAPTSAPDVLSSFEVGLSTEIPFVQVSNPALLESASALPYQLYAIITAGVLDDLAFGWGTTFALLGVVLSFFAVAVASRRYFRRKLHHD
jgi:phosphate transport system permease protein